MKTELENEIIGHWEEGFSIGDIATMLSIGLYDVTGVLSKYGYLTPPRNQ